MITLVITLFVAMIVFGMLIRKSSRFYLFYGTTASAFFLFLGLVLSAYTVQLQMRNAALVTKEVPVLLRIISDPESRENNVRCRAIIVATLKDSTFSKVAATTMLYLKRNSRSEKLRYGDEICVVSGVRNPSPTMNPGEFDYAAWLESQGIRFVCFAKDEWSQVGHDAQSWLKEKALLLRRYFKERLIVVGLTGQELAVSEALLLGQSSDIDPTLLASYSASGTLHVLSVSGMHVALVFVVLLKILAPLEKNRKTRIVSFAIQFFVIWFYAFMTGVSPSVLRSVMMLSVIILGRVIKRDAHLLNTLAASALLLLLTNPLLIKDAGFLLSYCAVAGIVIAQPLVEMMWRPKSKLIKPVWSLISVTLAAQVFTFPLGLYFFQQFPTWFLLSNLIVIPLSTICLYAGIALLSISWWTWGATMFAFLFGFLIQMLNASVSYTEYLPAAVLHTSAWDGIQIALLYGAILFALVRLVHKTRITVIASLICLCVLIVTIAAGRHFDAKQKAITIFQVRNGVVLGVRNGNQVSLFSDSTTISNPELFSYHVFPTYEKSNIREPNVERFDTEDSLKSGISTLYNGWLFAMNKRLWVGGKNEVPNSVHDCDVLLIHRNNFWMIEQLRVIHSKKIVLSAEVKPKWVAKWKVEADQQKIPIHITSEDGAFILNCN